MRNTLLAAALSLSFAVRSGAEVLFHDTFDVTSGTNAQNLNDAPEGRITGTLGSGSNWSVIESTFGDIATVNLDGNGSLVIGNRVYLGNSIGFGPDAFEPRRHSHSLSIELHLGVISTDPAYWAALSFSSGAPYPWPYNGVLGDFGFILRADGNLVGFSGYDVLFDLQLGTGQHDLTFTFTGQDGISSPFSTGTDQTYVTVFQGATNLGNYGLGARMVDPHYLSLMTHGTESVLTSATFSSLQVYTTVPEPSTYGLALGALALAGIAARRRRS